MAKKKSSVTDTKKNLQFKPPLSHKGFYTLLLTALLGMFIFVSYYASQQTQVYKSQASACGGVTCPGKTQSQCLSASNCCAWTTLGGGYSGCLAKPGPSSGGNCSKGGLTCGTWNKCCSPWVCSGSTVGTCVTPTPPCAKAGASCGPGTKLGCCPNAGKCTNGKCLSVVTYSTCNQVGDNCCPGPAVSGAGICNNGLVCSGGKCSKSSNVNPPPQNHTIASNTNCIKQGKPCGNQGGSGCCSPNVCRNKNAQGVGTCLAPAGGGGGGGGTGTNACTTAGGTCKMKANGCSSNETNINKDCAGPDPANKICCKASSGGGGGSSCTSITDKIKCNNTSGCKYFLTCNKCDSGSKGNLEVCGGGGGSPTPTPGNPCVAAGGICRVLANGCAAGEVEDTSLACAGPDPANKICCQAGVSGTPTPTPGATGTATFDLSLSFQGITTTPLSGQDTMDVLVTLSGGALTSDVPTTSTFTVDDSGVWTGEVSFPNVPAGDGYKLLVKGPKHLQKKVCDSTPTETSPGTYHCGDGNITVSTSSVNTVDFSGIKLLVGDLPAQDGIVDSYDISLVRNGFCTTANPDICHDSTLLSQADLNLDGIIDSQDYSLLISSLSVKQDEQ